MRRAGWVIGPLVFSLYSAACASTGAVPRPFPTPGGKPAAAAPAPATPAAPAPAAPAPAGPTPSVFPGTPPPPAPLAPAAIPPPYSSNLDGYALVGTALSLRGTPYRNGGSDPSGFDCSGFTQYVFAQYGVALPREVREQYRVGKSVNEDDLVAGDMLFFTTTDPGPSHVGIAIGGDEFVHAPSTTGVVRVEHLSSTYWSPRFLGARRLGN